MNRPQSPSRPFTLKFLMRIGVALPLWLGFIALPLTGAAAVFNVIDTASLYAAIATANSNNEDDIVNLTAGTYLLTGGALTPASDSGHTLEIKSTDAGGARTTIIDGNNANRVFQMVFAVVTISDVTITNGNAGTQDGGGGIVTDFFQA